MDALTEISYYHPPDAGGWVAVAQIHNSKFQSRLHPVEDLVAVIQALDPELDTYVSQAAFSGRRRRAADVSRLGCLYVDCDTRTTPYGRLAPADQCAELLAWCEDTATPVPSLINHSGAGLHVKWFLDEPMRDDACEMAPHLNRALGQRLTPFGTDIGCSDVARILRVVGTRHTRSGNLVRTLHPFQREPFRWSLETLLFELESDNGERTADAALEFDKTVRTPSNTGGLVRFDRQRLARDRYEDLCRLLEMRGWDATGIPVGHRNTALKFAAIFLCGCLDRALVLSEIRLFAEAFIPTFRAEDVNSTVSSILSRNESGAQGRRVEWKGRQRHPLYYFRNSQIIAELGITDTEQRELKTLIDVDEARRRDRERKRRPRNREAYQEECRELRERAWELRQNGFLYRDIGNALGISTRAAESHVRRMKSQAAL